MLVSETRHSLVPHSTKHGKALEVTTAGALTNMLNDTEYLNQNQIYSDEVYYYYRLLRRELNQ